LHNMLCLRSSSVSCKRSLPTHVLSQQSAPGQAAPKLESMPWSSKVALSARSLSTSSKGSSGGQGYEYQKTGVLSQGQTLMEIDNNRVVAVADVPLEEIKLDIANNLLKEELQVVEEFEELSFHNAIGKRFLQESNFKFTDNNDGTAYLTKSDPTHNVRVAFKTYEQETDPNENEDEMGENEGLEELDEGELEGEGEGEHGAVSLTSSVPDAEFPDSPLDSIMSKRDKSKNIRMNAEEGADELVLDAADIKSLETKEGLPDTGEHLPKRQDFIVDIEFMKKGKVKGTWRLHCFAGHQNRLYVDHMQVLDGAIDAPRDLEDIEQLVPNSRTANLYSFDTLGVETQDRIYDLLDKFGVDDQLGHFVKQYPLRKKCAQETSFLNRLKELLSSTIPSDYKASNIQDVPPPTTAGGPRRPSPGAAPSGAPGSAPTSARPSGSPSATGARPGAAPGGPSRPAAPGSAQAPGSATRPTASVRPPGSK